MFTDLIISVQNDLCYLIRYKNDICLEQWDVSILKINSLFKWTSTLQSKHMKPHQLSPPKASAWTFPSPFSARVLAFLASRFCLSLLSFSLVITQFEGWIGIWYGCPKGVNGESEESGCTVGLSLCDLLNVNVPSSAVDLSDLAYVSLITAAGHANLIIFPDGHRSNIVFLPQILGEGSRHELPPDMGRCSEMRLTVLSPGA